MNREQLLEQINSKRLTFREADGPFSDGWNSAIDAIAALPYFSAAPSGEGVDYKAAWEELGQMMMNRLHMNLPPDYHSALVDMLGKMEILGCPEAWPVAPSPATEPPMTEHHFTCPECGGHYFGRDMKRGPDGEVVVLNTVECHGDGSDKPYRKCWRGVWPPVGERPERPPMLFGRLAPIDSFTRWMVRHGNAWFMGDRHRKSADIDYVCREYSEPKALALYDAERAREGREGGGR